MKLYFCINLFIGEITAFFGSNRHTMSIIITIFAKQPHKTMAKIYVASSWRNQYYPDVLKKLREYGHEVYDFRNPPHNHGAFMWKDVDPEFDKWNVNQYKQGLQHPSSERQFQADLDALNWADTCLLVLPCGRSAHTEAGWMKGSGKKVIVYIPEMQEAELMYKLFDLVSGDLDEINEFICKPTSHFAFK